MGISDFQEPSMTYLHYTQIQHKTDIVHRLNILTHVHLSVSTSKHRPKRLNYSTKDTLPSGIPHTVDILWYSSNRVWYLQECTCAKQHFYMISLSRPYQETVDCPRLGVCPWLGVFIRRLFSFRVNTYLDNHKHLIIFFLLRSLKRDKIYMLQQVQAFGATPQPSGLGAILLRWQFFFFQLCTTVWNASFTSIMVHFIHP